MRIGNAAAKQFQLDIAGDVMDAVYLYNKYGEPISHGLWEGVRRLTDWVCDRWQDPDEGIWEVRGGRDQFTFSKLMCWVALDRAQRIADKRSFPADLPRWIAARDAIYETVMARGYSREAAFLRAMLWTGSSWTRRCSSPRWSSSFPPRTRGCSGRSTPSSAIS